MIRLLRGPQHLVTHIEGPREDVEPDVEYRAYKDYPFSEEDFLVGDWIRADRFLPDYLVDMVRIIYEQETIFDHRHLSDAVEGDSLLEKVSVQTSRGFGAAHSFARDDKGLRWDAIDKCGGELPHFQDDGFEHAQCIDWRVLAWKYYEPFPLERFSYEYFDKHPNTS